MIEHSAVAVARGAPAPARRLAARRRRGRGRAGAPRAAAGLAAGPRRPSAPGPRSPASLWPDSTDERALASLRRAVLQCQQRCPGLLDAARLTVALDPGVAGGRGRPAAGRGADPAADDRRAWPRAARRPARRRAAARLVRRLGRGGACAARAAARRGAGADRAARRWNGATSRWRSTRPAAAIAIEPLRESAARGVDQGPPGHGTTRRARCTSSGATARCWTRSSASHRPPGSGPWSSRRRTHHAARRRAAPRSRCRASGWRRSRSRPHAGHLPVGLSRSGWPGSRRAGEAGERRTPCGCRTSSVPPGSPWPWPSRSRWRGPDPPCSGHHGPGRADGARQPSCRHGGLRIRGRTAAGPDRPGEARRLRRRVRRVRRPRDAAAGRGAARRARPRRPPRRTPCRRPGRGRSPGRRRRPRSRDLPVVGDVRLGARQVSGEVQVATPVADVAEDEASGAADHDGRAGGRDAVAGADPVHAAQPHSRPHATTPSPTSRPSPSPSPTGTPTDPGTVAPTPVG